MSVNPVGAAHKGKPSQGAPKPYSDWHIPDRYKIRGLIGTGSYGHVCEAWDSEKNTAVAIKRVHHVFEDLVDCKRILREIAILNRLMHKNIVKIVDLVTPRNLKTFDDLYVVLEIADSDFKKVFRSSVYLTEVHCHTLLYNLMVGLKACHSAQIFHRDLKPANCLVNQDCTVKICDFGLARTMGSAKQDAIDNDEQSSTHRQARQLTGHVVTRWYRAPELILLQENYNEAIDVWSAGCIFAELLGTVKENVGNATDRAPLFPGSSCFPLSPDQKHAKETRFHKGNRDQLNVIFDVIGTPSEEDIESLEKADAKRYIQVFAKRPKTKLEKRFPAASPDAIDLLDSMLIFNPKKRITVDDALAHPLFKKIRNLKLEKEAAKTPKVELPFNDWANLSEVQLRSAFLHEISRFDKSVLEPQ